MWVAFEQEMAASMPSAYYFPWQFSVEAYGAKGDGRVVGDVSTTLNSKVITSSSAGFVNAAAPAGDVGKYVMIHGGNGTGSGPYIDVIASVQSSTQATLTTNLAGATVSNCPMVWGTDDTAAINSAMSAAGAYATIHGAADGSGNFFAEILFGANIYILGTGPAQTGNGSTTPTFNAQIALPYPNTNGTTQKLIIALTGAGDAGYCQYWESLVPNVAGSALVSMAAAPSTPSGTFGNQSVVGGPSAAAGFTGGYANVKVAVKGLSVWLPIFTNVWAWDFGYLSAMRVQQSAAHIFAPAGFNGSAVQPYMQNITASAFTGSIGTGWHTPINQNNDDCVMDDVTAEGYECGFRVYDHFAAGRLAAIYSDVAMKVQGEGGVGHLVAIQNMSAEVYNGGLLAGGSGGSTCDVDIGWSAESVSPAYDIADAGNVLHGVVRFRDPADAGRGITVSGAANLKVINNELSPGHWAGAPGVPLTTVAQQNTAWRDAMVVLTSGGAAVSVIAVDGTATGATLGTTGSVTVPVPAGHTITLTYASTAPTWVWYLL
jgi:hypothetical protein